jgi:anti-sigma factor RsiW
MKYSDEDLVRYADNTISAERRHRLLDAAEHDAELANTLAALDASKLPFKAAFDQQPLPPVPPALRNEVATLVGVAGSDNVSRLDVTGKKGRSSTYPRWPLYLAQAACLALCVGIGFVIGTANQSIPDGNSVELNVTADGNTGSALGTQRQWVERVADYQTLYVENTVANLEPDLPGALAQLDTLGQASGVKVAVPDLSDAGYQFARVQELGFEGQALVQVVYTSDGKAPLALCYMLANGELDEHLVLSSRHGLGTASWITDNQRFVVVADESEETLRELYQITRVSFPEA